MAIVFWVNNWLISYILWREIVLKSKVGKTYISTENTRPIQRGTI